jgi:phospholipase C
VSWKDYHYGTGLVGHGMLPQFKNFQDATLGTPLYDKSIALSEIWQFEYDALHDNLATVSWRHPPNGASEHPAEPGASPAGFRVPCIVVSPWSACGYVCSEKFDHTFVLQFLEKVIGVMEQNISDWWRQTFGDLSRTLHFGRHTPLL